MSDETPADPAREARNLLRARPLGALATALPGRQATGAAADESWPFASLVTYALDSALAPLLLLSGLSDHTKALQVEARCSLLVEATAGFDNPQAGPRLTLLCRAAPEPSPEARRRYLARHPAAEMYAGFADFRIWRLAPERVHFVGGFARARWMEWRDVTCPTPPALDAAEAGIVGHMNEDHHDAIDLYAARLLGRSGTGWRMTGIDGEGCDLRREGEIARLDFPSPIATALEARQTLVALVGKARAQA